MKAAGGRDSGEWRRIELQLDTAQLVLLAAALVALGALCFYLGRWTAGRGLEPLARGTPASPGNVSEVDTAADLTVFDTMGEAVAEPGRQAKEGPVRPVLESGQARPQAEPGEAGLTEPATAGSEAPGSSRAEGTSRPDRASERGQYAVQVFAGERTQAQKIAASLTSKGFRARVVAGSSGPASARVRVYGYETREEAEKAAARLAREGSTEPWIVPAD